MPTHPTSTWHREGTQCAFYTTVIISPYTSPVAPAFVHFLVFIARLVTEAWLSAPGLCGLCYMSVPWLGWPLCSCFPDLLSSLSIPSLAWPSSNACYLGPKVSNLYGSCVSDVLTKNPATNAFRGVLPIRHSLCGNHLSGSASSWKEEVGGGLVVSVRLPFLPPRKQTGSNPQPVFSRQSGLPEDCW